MDIAGKIAVITGAGSGIGFAIAQELSARGCQLMLIDSHPERLDAVSQALSPMARHAVDVSDPHAVTACAADIARETDTVHFLINSAGVALHGEFLETANADLRWVMETNFFGTVHCCRAFLPLLKAAAPSRILNVSSSFAWTGFPGKSAYCASKHALRGFSETLRLELERNGIGVTALYPGPVDTGIIRHGRAVSESQRAREASFLARRGVPLDCVARAAVDGMLANHPRVVLSPDYRALDILTRFAPRALRDAVIRLGARSIR